MTLCPSSDTALFSTQHHYTVSLPRSTLFQGHEPQSHDVPAHFPAGGVEAMNSRSERPEHLCERNTRRPDGPYLRCAHPSSSAMALGVRPPKWSGRCDRVGSACHIPPTGKNKGLREEAAQPRMLVMQSSRQSVLRRRSQPTSPAPSALSTTAPGAGIEGPVDSGSTSSRA